MIKTNFSELSKTPRKKAATLILHSGLMAALPQNSLKKYFRKNQLKIGKKKIPLSKYSMVHLIAFGKAADSMALQVNSSAKIDSGIIVIPKGSKSLVAGKKFKIFHAGHPVPTKTSVAAAKSIVSYLQNTKKDDFVIFLVSGGASSLISYPNDISLNEKIKLTKLLLKSGASIQEINCVRKHLSKIKGGRLLEHLKCPGIALVLSDVLNDDLSSIASGTTYFDNTTYYDARKVISKYKLGSKIPKKIIQILNEGALGKIPDTPKTPKIQNIIISNNSDCLAAMKEASKKLGFKTKILKVSGNVNKAAKFLVKSIPKTKNSCVIFGGETTVNVKGKGKGGRNQELVLRVLANLDTSESVVVASMGTDGIDGNTNYAGAILESFKLNKDKIQAYLKNNNSNQFFREYGGLIKTGYTHTNLLDIGLILK